MINKFFGVGNLGRDPEVRYTPDGTAVTNFSIACSEKWTKDGEKKEKTEWINIVAWGKLAEICGEYLTKGSMVAVVGKMQTRKWEDKEGNNRYTTEININEMKMLGGKSAPKVASDEAPSGGGYDDDSEIPF